MTTTLPKIAGLRSISEHAKDLAGKLTLPLEFPRHKYAAKWAEKGFGAQQEMQEQHVAPGIIADGWQVFKVRGKVFTRILSSKVYILMFRPKELQNTINKICGNLSREKIVGQHSGKRMELPEGATPGDRSMLTNADLQAVERVSDDSDDIRRALPPNPIQPLETAGASKATLKPKKSIFSKQT